jgi:hypothetical protein
MKTMVKKMMKMKMNRLEILIDFSISYIKTAVLTNKYATSEVIRADNQLGKAVQTRTNVI